MRVVLPGFKAMVMHSVLRASSVVDVEHSWVATASHGGEGIEGEGRRWDEKEVVARCDVTVTCHGNSPKKSFLSQPDARKCRLMVAMIEIE